MSDNWVVQNLENAIGVWNEKLEEIRSLITASPETFRGGGVWETVRTVHGALQAVGLALLVLFFAVGVMKTCGSFAELKKPEVIGPDWLAPQEWLPLSRRVRRASKTS